MSCCESFFILGDIVDKIELLIPWFEVIQTTLMHYELHVWFTFILSMDHEHHLIAPVGNHVPETQVSQHYNIGDGIFTEPHTVVAAVCLAGNCHRSVIALKSHFSFPLIGLLH